MLRPVLSIAPHSGVGGCGPSPRNESPEAVRIAVARRSVVWTTSGGVTFGRTWRHMMPLAGSPSARAAST